MNTRKPNIPKSAQVPQILHNSELVSQGPLQSLEPTLWNSKIGRRLFLKKTGAATVGTAIALHGFRTEVMASTSGPQWYFYQDIWENQGDPEAIVVSLIIPGAVFQTLTQLDLLQRLRAHFDETTVWTTSLTWISGTEHLVDDYQRIETTVRRETWDGSKIPFLTATTPPAIDGVAYFVDTITNDVMINWSFVVDSGGKIVVTKRYTGEKHDERPL